MITNYICMSSEREAKLDECEYWRVVNGSTVGIEASRYWFRGEYLEMQEFYLNGKREGEIKMWYGQGRREGEHKVWHTNGKIKTKGFYRSGNPEGMRRHWDEKGRLMIREFYQEGCLEGERAGWHANGTLAYREFHRNGFQEGEYKSWYRDSHPLNYEYWVLGMPIDSSFSLRKKMIFLRMKRIVRNRITHLPESIIIPDLERVIYLY